MGTNLLARPIDYERDIEALSVLVKEQAHTHGSTVSIENAKRIIAYVRERSFNSPSFVVCNREQGEEKVVALVSCSPLYTMTGKSLYLQDIVVDKECRGCGIGLYAFQALAHNALEEGYDRITWDVAPDNLSAQRFYGKIGAEASEDIYYERKENLKSLDSLSKDASYSVESLSQKDYLLLVEAGFLSRSAHFKNVLVAKKKGKIKGMASLNTFFHYDFAEDGVSPSAIYEDSLGKPIFFTSSKEEKAEAYRSIVRHVALKERGNNRLFTFLGAREDEMIRGTVASITDCSEKSLNKYRVMYIEEEKMLNLAAEYVMTRHRPQRSRDHALAAVHR